MNQLDTKEGIIQESGYSREQQIAKGEGTCGVLLDFVSLPTPELNVTLEEDCGFPKLVLEKYKQVFANRAAGIGRREQVITWSNIVDYGLVGLVSPTYPANLHADEVFSGFRIYSHNVMNLFHHLSGLCTSYERLGCLIRLLSECYDDERYLQNTSALVGEKLHQNLGFQNLSEMDFAQSSQMAFVAYLLTMRLSRHGAWLVNSKTTLRSLVNPTDSKKSLPVLRDGFFKTDLFVLARTLGMQLAVDHRKKKENIPVFTTVVSRKSEELKPDLRIEGLLK
jgi:hypothetical protein